MALASALIAVIIVVPGECLANDPVPTAQKGDLGLITGSLGAPDLRSDAEKYCFNIADQAADARFAWQAKTIADLEKDIDSRITELDRKRAEYQDWLERREEILAKAEDHLVDVFAKMRPESASVQIAALDDAMAAAVLSKLKARTASAILNDMDPARAAQLTKAMVDVAQGKRRENKS